MRGFSCRACSPSNGHIWLGPKNSGPGLCCGPVKEGSLRAGMLGGQKPCLGLRGALQVHGQEELRGCKGDGWEIGASTPGLFWDTRVWRVCLRRAPPTPDPVLQWHGRGAVPYETCAAFGATAVSQGLGLCEVPSLIRDFLPGKATAAPAPHFGVEPGLAGGCADGGGGAGGLCQGVAQWGRPLWGRSPAFGRETPPMAPGKLGKTQGTPSTWSMPPSPHSHHPQRPVGFGVPLRTGRVLERAHTLLQWGCTAPCLWQSLTLGHVG